MDMQNQAALIKMLEFKIEDERKKYRVAMRNDFPLWKIKEIHHRIKELENTLKSLQSKV